MVARARRVRTAHRPSQGASGRGVSGLCRPHRGRKAFCRPGAASGRTCLSHRSAGFGSHYRKHASRRPLRKPESTQRENRRRVLQQPRAPTAGAGSHWHQWQNIDGLVAGTGAQQSRQNGPVRTDRHLRNRHTGTRQRQPRWLVRQWFDNPGWSFVAAQLARFRRPGFAILRAGSLVDWNRGKPLGRDRHTACHLHQFHPGSSGLPRHDASLLGSQAAPV